MLSTSGVRLPELEIVDQSSQYDLENYLLKLRGAQNQQPLSPTLAKVLFSGSNADRWRSRLLGLLLWYRTLGAGSLGSPSSWATETEKIKTAPRSQSDWSSRVTFHAQFWQGHILPQFPISQHVLTSVTLLSFLTSRFVAQHMKLRRHVALLNAVLIRGGSKESLLCLLSILEKEVEWVHSERMLCETWQGFTRLCTNLKWQDSGSCRRTAKPCEHMPTSVRTLLSRGTIGWDSDFDLCEAGEAHIFRNFNPGTAVWQQVLLQVDGKKFSVRLLFFERNSTQALWDFDEFKSTVAQSSGQTWQLQTIQTVPFLWDTWQRQFWGQTDPTNFSVGMASSWTKVASISHSSSVRDTEVAPPGWLEWPWLWPAWRQVLSLQGQVTEDLESCFVSNEVAFRVVVARESMFSMRWSSLIALLLHPWHWGT